MAFFHGQSQFFSIKGFNFEQYILVRTWVSEEKVEKAHKTC